jgi:predicted transcriptional regulator
MRVSKAMTRDVYIANPEETIQQAAITMAGIDAGALPVANNDRLIGMITDRDIAVRGVAEGKSPNTPVRDVMTTDVKYCFDDQDRRSPSTWETSRSGVRQSSTATNASWASFRLGTLPLSTEMDRPAKR